MAAPSNWTPYNDCKLNVCKKLIDMSADTFYVALFTSASAAISTTVTPATYTAFAADGHEVTNANGYTTGGVSVGAGSLTGGGLTATITFDTSDAAFTATSSGITARAAVLYDYTAASKYAVAYCILDSTPADVVVSAGNTLTINIANVTTFS